MACHPIIAHAIRAHGCDPVGLTALARSAGCAFELGDRAGKPDIAHVSLSDGRTVVTWPRQGVVLDEAAEGAGVLRSVQLPLAVPDTVAAASTGRPLRDLVRIAGDPGMRMAHVGPALAPGRTHVTLMPWTEAHLAPDVEA
jgi:hypothetical protein